MDRHSLFSKLLVYFFITLVLSIIVTTLFMTLNFERILTRQLYLSQKNNLYNASYGMDNIYSSVKSLAIQVYFDDQISKMRNLQEPSYDEHNQALSDLRLYASIVPFVKSIVLYNHLSETFSYTFPYGNFGSTMADDFFDRDLIDLLNEVPHTPVLYPIYREIPTLDGLGNLTIEMGFTLIFYSRSDGVNEGAVIINMSLGWIDNMLSEFDPQYANKTLVYDNDNRLLLTFSEGNFPLSSQWEDVILSGLNAKNSDDNDNYGFFSIGDDENETLTLFITYKPFDWTFVRLIPMKDILSDVKEMRLRVVLLGSLAFLLLAILLLLFLPQVYKPFEKVIKNSSEMEKELERVLMQKKLSNLKGYLKGERGAGLPFPHLSFFETDGAEKGVLRLLWINIKDYSKFCSRYSFTDRDIVKQHILDLADPIPGDGYSCRGLDMGEDHLVVFLRGGRKEDDEQIFAFCQSFLGIVGDELDIKLSIVISLPGLDLDDLPELYEFISRYKVNQFFFSDKPVLFTQELVRKQGIGFEYPVKLQIEYAQLLFTGKLDKAEFLFFEILSLADEFSWQTMRLALQRLITATYIALDSMGKNLVLSLDYDYEECISHTDQLPYHDDVLIFFHTFFDVLKQRFEESRKGKHEELVSNVIKIVDKKYGNPNLSMELLAEQFSISPAYLGRLFKQQRGISLVDHLNRVRINNAKEKLMNSDCTATKLALEVGFTNSQHFYRVFKRLTGKTPLELRKENSPKRDKF